MKTLSRLLLLAALATAFALPAFAQDPAASPAAASPCEETARGEMYTDYYNKKKTDQKAAYDVGKQYLAKYESCGDTYAKAVRKFVDLYDKATLRYDFFKAYDAKDVAKLKTLGSQLLVNDPNDTAVALLAAAGTYQGTVDKNPAATQADALNYINKALALVEGGQEPKDLSGKINWAPFSGKEEAISYLNLDIASLELKTNLSDATPRLVKIAQGNSKLKEDPSIYSYLAFAYGKEAEPLLAKYKDVTKNFTVETDESKLLLANINQIVDRTIDAYARAVAYSTKPADKAEFMSRLTELYKERHNQTDAGLTEYIAGIKAQPLLMTQPITTLPAATPATTPAGGTGDGVATTSTTMSVPAPASGAMKPATSTTMQPKPQTTMQPKPQTTPTVTMPAKKKP